MGEAKRKKAHLAKGDCGDPKCCWHHPPKKPIQLTWRDAPEYYRHQERMRARLGMVIDQVLAAGRIVK